jgi:hypothetical protein
MADEHYCQQDWRVSAVAAAAAQHTTRKGVSAAQDCRSSSADDSSKLIRSLPASACTGGSHSSSRACFRLIA